MSYRIITREADGSLGYSSAIDDKGLAISWAGDLALIGVEILRIDCSDGEVIEAEIVSAACSARKSSSSTGAERAEQRRRRGSAVC